MASKNFLYIILTVRKIFYFETPNLIHKIKFKMATGQAGHHGALAA